jgi:hypothetical protein
MRSLEKAFEGEGGRLTETGATDFFIHFHHHEECDGMGFSVV